MTLPVQVTAEFSAPFASSAAAKTDIARHVTAVVLPDKTKMELVGFPVQDLRDLIAEWMTLPETLFLHYFPWIHEVYGCDGDCDEAAYANAAEMAEWMTGNGIAPVILTGTPADFGFQALPPQPSSASRWPERLLRHHLS